VIDSREIMRGTNSVPQVLIEWEGLSSTAATWEDKEDIALIYPNFSLEVKASVNGGSIARTPIIELGPQDNKSAQKDNITVSDTEIKGLRRSQRIRIPSNKLKGYIYN
jgi:hypothetical protein